MDHLFVSNGRTTDAFDANLRMAVQQCKEKALDEVVGATGEITRNDLVTEFQFDPIEIHRDHMHLSHADVRIDARGLSGRIVSDRSEPLWIDGTRFTFAVPFSGHPALLNMTPGSLILTNPPQGRINAHSSELEYIEEHPSDSLDADAIRARFDRWLATVEDLAEKVTSDVEDYNSELRRVVEQAILQREEKLRRDLDVASSIGIDVQRRSGAESIPIAITDRRAMSVRPEKRERRRGQKWEPEPQLLDADYEEVLRVIQMLATTAERLPGTFQGLPEESIRDLILFYLNGTFEGAAGGELFNGEGKSDILVRVDNRNAFIGECKIWDGPSKFEEAIDQILRYIVWRDSKAAMVLIIKTLDATRTISRARETLTNHPLCAQVLPHQDESARSDFIFRNANDEDRLISLALLPVVLTPREVG